MTPEERLAWFRERIGMPRAEPVDDNSDVFPMHVEQLPNLLVLETDYPDPEDAPP